MNIELTHRDRQALSWLQARADNWLFAFKRRRKYSPRSNFSDQELETLKAITGIRDSASRLLDG